MKLIVPVYDTKLVASVRAAAAAGGHIAAIVNPESGPGKKADADWKYGINELRSSGAQILYYVGLLRRGEDDDGEPKTLAELKEEMDKYVKFYNPAVGWFFDDLLPFTTARANRLKSVVSYKGGFTVANPGTSDGDTKKYLETGITVLVTWERAGYTDRESVTEPPSWEKTCGARIGVMATDESGFQDALGIARKRNVNLFYATNAKSDSRAGGGNIGTWDRLPPYFKAMAKAVSTCDVDVPVG